ncbi:MAG: diaminopimelate epimerase [Muribaculum sp.]|nr:diaminopimelate epimerase [Muribaculum sp.]
MKTKDSIRFTKMHGTGNDYIYIDAMHDVPDNLPLLARRISDRHFGVGSDGLVAIMPSMRADFRMRMFNADGSEAQMCGNASRCIGKYVYEKGLTQKTCITLETLAGIRVLNLNVDRGKVLSVEVDMGEPKVMPDQIPVVSKDGTPLLNKDVEVEGMTFRLTSVGMGNPHGVVFTETLTDYSVLTLGPKLETAPIWPERANIEFVKVLDRRHIRMRVWERGSGETLACGTGACACVVAAVMNGLTEREVYVELIGGTLFVRWNLTDNHVYLCGNAEFIAEGEYYPAVAMKEDII